MLNFGFLLPTRLYVNTVTIKMMKVNTSIRVLAKCKTLLQVDDISAMVDGWGQCVSRVFAVYCGLVSCTLE